MTDGADPTAEARQQEAALAGLDEVTLAVRDLTSAAQDLTIRMARRMGTNVSDMTAVMLLNRDGPLGVVALARELGVTTAATTVLIDRLERAGHVQRVRATDDRRRVSITATAAGMLAVQRAWLPAILDIDVVCRGFAEPERTLARELMERLTAVMLRTGRS